MMIPVLAIVALALSMNHDARWLLVGADYSRRLFITIAVLIVLTLINAVIATISKA